MLVFPILKLHPDRNVYLSVKKKTNLSHYSFPLTKKTSVGRNKLPRFHPFFPPFNQPSFDWKNGQKKYRLKCCLLYMLVKAPGQLLRPLELNSQLGRRFVLLLKTRPDSRYCLGRWGAADRSARRSSLRRRAGCSAAAAPAR